MNWHRNFLPILKFMLVGFAVIGFLLQNTMPLAALSEEQRRIIDSGILYFDVESENLVCQTTSLVGSDNVEKAWNFLISKGLTPQQTAGIVGNLQSESGPSIDPEIVSSSGYRGIAQWDGNSGGRWSRLVDWARENGRNELELETQLEYIWLEATERGNIEGIKQYDDVPHTTWYWGRYFEVAIIGGSTSEVPLTNVQHLSGRTSNAENLFIEYGSGTNLVGGGNCEMSPDNCPTGPISANQTVVVSGISVHPCIAQEVERIVSLANSQGLDMSGGGYRDAEGQIQARRDNCGSSQYDIYEKPASACSPPTAQPGNSRHESGTAVDFTCGGTVIGSRSHPCFVFLEANTGLLNLPSEPWHWSIDGN